MKHLLQIFGIVTLVVGSFIYSEEVATTAKLSDELLNEIKARKVEYKVKSIEAIIEDGTIIPGKNGKQVDVKKSYKNMKEIGYFNEKLLVYKYLSVKEPLNKNMDKYIISGNKNEKSISLIIKVGNNSNLNKLIGKLNEKKIKATFFVNSNFLENNNDLIIGLINNGHTIGNLSNNGDYEDNDFGWMKTIITNIGGQRYNYCLAEKKDQTIIDVCKEQKSYTIMPIMINKKPFINVKQTLTPGGILAFEYSEELNNEIENIINYITSKGYSIKSLEKHLKE